ncbi:glutathione S-transferase [Sinorhizobium medicae]|nr:glutathione S-transferase [Sinorhizobium medicae]
MKLYHHPLSGHAHRVRLFLSLLGIEHELVLVDLASKEHKQEPFLKLNPFGQLPVLDDGGTIVPDSNAILVYLAKKAGRADWLPEDARGAAAVQRWLSVAAGQIAHGPAQARLITLFKAPYRQEEVIPRSHAILALIESGDVDLQPYPEIRSWLARIEALPGFVEFQKTPAGLAA